MAAQVPQSSSHEASRQMLDRLARFGEDEPAEQRETAHGRVTLVLLVIACVLSVIGILLSLCSLCIVAMPESGLSSALLGFASMLS